MEYIGRCVEPSKKIISFYDCRGLGVPYIVMCLGACFENRKLERGGGGCAGLRTVLWFVNDLQVLSGTNRKGEAYSEMT